MKKALLNYIIKLLILVVTITIVWILFAGLSNTFQIIVIGLIFLYWLLYIGYEIYYFHNTKKPIQRNTSILTFISPFIITIVLYFSFFMPKIYYSEKSPDDLYELIIYSKPKLYSSPGDGSAICAIIKLFDSKGNLLRQNCKACPVYVNQIQIRWDLANHQVFYTNKNDNPPLPLSVGSCD